MKENCFYINGLFFSQKTTGVHRFARQLLMEIDKICGKDEIVVVVPMGTNTPLYHNIQIVEYGTRHGLLWEQFDYPIFLRKHKGTGVNLCNSQPLLKPGIICIHDVAYKTHPEYFKTLHGKLSVAWHKLVYRIAAWSKMPILTVSYFSKYSIVDTYHVSPNRIHVISNGWQHISNVKPAEHVLDKYGLQEKAFYFTLGNINYNKNTKWVVEYAQKHPQDTFVLSGIRVKNSDIDIDHVKNVKWLGYLSDNEIVALYKYCKAFIFPSIHEGFGIPPMEALSQGAKIIIANTTCLPEIYQSGAIYIDPYDTDVDLESLLNTTHVDAPNLVLSRYSWKSSAEKLYKLLKSM